MKTPCETTEIIDNRKTKLFSYVVTYTEIDGSKVQAIRFDGYRSKYDPEFKEVSDLPGWKVKNIQRLYSSDFDK